MTECEITLFQTQLGHLAARILGRRDIVLRQRRHGCGDWNQDAPPVTWRQNSITRTGRRDNPMTTVTACTCTVVLAITDGLITRVQAYAVPYVNWTCSPDKFLEKNCDF